MKELYDHDDRFAAAKLGIEQTECLMIDEISMLSRKILELLESVIVCGDFKQLPPVPNQRLGCYCLESDVFKNAFVHHINLTKVIRQNEADLIKAVHELCDCSPSEETDALLKSLDRPLPDNTKMTSLYWTNFDVNFINHEKLVDLAGEECVFKAKDEGQMGVAVGRVETKAGLRVRNFNRSAATLKHPSCVYDFYNLNNMKEPLDGLSCCKTNTTTKFHCATFHIRSD
ncbi:PIF1 [Mytilus edulis]|uniref:PIF1 n=1 Tax=Mytilus edulis TaxID=6550 RepID=A0A8S3VEC2_MYTED|nr:PIF1 [Mytilus edulis]